MKKLIAIIAILAFATTVFATESDPSETVGFIKIDADVGYTPFGLPFTFYDALHAQTMALDDIIGAQFTGSPIPPQSDQIIDINTGAYGTYNSVASAWVGMTSFTANHAQYAYVLSGHPNVDMYLAGQVDQSSIDFGTMDVGYNVVGIREAGVVNVSDLDLVSSGFTGSPIPPQSDQLIDMNTGAFATYNPGTLTWVGALTTVTPGHTYYVFVRSGHTPFDWTYDPTGAKASKSTNVIKVKANKR